MSLVTLDVSGGIALLKMNSPEKLNALNSKVLKALDQTLDTVAADTSIKVLLITGEGKAFVAGADIREMVDLDAKGGETFSALGNGVFQKLANLDVPSIAIVNGYALGGGLELALACDIRLASEKAKMGFPEVGLGIIPGFGGTQRAAKIIGPSKTKELIYSAKIIRSDEALVIGMVNEVYSADELMDKGYELATAIAKNSSNAVKMAKCAVDEGLSKPFDEGLKIEATNFGNCFNHADQKEGMTAFIEKRDAAFK